MLKNEGLQPLLQLLEQHHASDTRQKPKHQVYKQKFSFNFRLLKRTLSAASANI